MKEYDKALETYQTGLQHEPDNAELKEGIERCVSSISRSAAMAFEWGSQPMQQMPI